MSIDWRRDDEGAPLRQMIDPDGWPADYFASRDRFLELARAAGARTAARAVEAVGPGGESLTVDTAALGPERPGHLVVLVGGVHGVEGFLGARVQTEALGRLAHDGLPDGVGIVLVHAANPWGFAHLRRVDADGVDVNRNFIDPCAPAPVSPPGYAALDPVINPRTPPRTGDGLGFALAAARLILRDRGIGALARTIAEGQHDFPRGLFFGGVRAGESCRTLQDIVLGASEGAGRVTVLDVHSGLGPSAVATLIASGNIDPPERFADRLRARHGRPVVVDGAPGNAYDARGTFSRWCRRALADTRFRYLCVEVGTVGPLAVLSALRRENRAHHWSAAGSEPYARGKRALVEVFAPRSRRWRRKSLAQGMHVLDRTLDPEAGPDR